MSPDPFSASGFARIQPELRWTAFSPLNSCEFSYERVVMNTKRHDYLKRLPPEYYRGQAYVHWSLTMEDRRTGWLIPIFYYKYREKPRTAWARAARWFCEVFLHRLSRSRIS